MLNVFTLPVASKDPPFSDTVPACYILSGSVPDLLPCNAILVPAGECLKTKKYFNYCSYSYYSQISKILALALFLASFPMCIANHSWDV